MAKVVFLLLGGIIAVTTFGVLALPSQCLQAPERSSPCPHIIYKKASIAVPELSVEQGQVICLCLTDLQALQNKSKTKLEQIDQEVTLQRLAKRYKLSHDEIKSLVNH